MKKIIASLTLAATAFANTSLFAAEGNAAPTGVLHLDHVWVILRENHGYGQLRNNPNAPFINKYAESANTADNYFAVAHPSLTNYLEIVGGSNFGVLADNFPDWHNPACTPNIVSGTQNNEHSGGAPVCPIYGNGSDAPTPAIDKTNETTGEPGTINIDGKMSIPADTSTHGRTIADQLVARGMTWKSYQENLPVFGADYVNYSDGTFTNNSILPAPLKSSDIVQLYAVKHNPFAYFQSVQDGYDPQLSLSQVRGFDGQGGLYEDLGSGKVPNFSLIAPNQCNDQHGRGNAGPICNFDPADNGTQTGLNNALIYQGDVTVQRLVTAIRRSPAWNRGRNAIVVVWDENDYSLVPITNQVLFIVDTNYGRHGVHSSRFYDHFSLLRSLEAGFGLSCLNHACDAQSKVMGDIF
ncbi:phosphoesterase [Candidatus Koribacter versatilis Ellin345]|uniref:Phosphoesterase n=1 Tax=Koribacter versatilis (strain Ellin345) TaxID=204669 RepID=Q1IRH7_KORVE|nr:alkaline phosphatase family protein [Candidatus Koribacter versatilis]ABF40523.1 phosphoesterase [Candidatus Koribacter versatilis Ellin345]